MNNEYLRNPVQDIYRSNKSAEGRRFYQPPNDLSLKNQYHSQSFVQQHQYSRRDTSISPEPDLRTNQTFHTFQSANKEPSFQDRFTRQQQYRQKIMQQINNQYEEDPQVNSPPENDFFNKCVTPREPENNIRSKRFESCENLQNNTRPPQIIRTQRQGSINSNSDMCYSSKFGRQYQEKSMGSIGSDHHKSYNNIHKVVEEDTDSKNGTKEQLLRFQDFYQNIEPRQERESSEKKHYPTFQYVSMIDQEPSDTPKSFGKNPDSSARGCDQSFLTNEVSYMAPQPFRSATELIEAKCQIKIQIEKLNKYKRKIKKQSSEKHDLQLQIQALQKSNYMLQEQNSKLLKEDFYDQICELKEANKQLQRELEFERSKRREQLIESLTNQYEEKLIEVKMSSKQKDQQIEQFKEQIKNMELEFNNKDEIIENKNSLLQRLEEKLVHFDQQFEVYDKLIKEFQEQKKLVMQKDEQIVAKQVELDWFKRLNSDKQLEVDLCQDQLKRIKEHKTALEEENRYLMQVIKDRNQISRLTSVEKPPERVALSARKVSPPPPLNLEKSGLNQSLSEDNLLASFRKISQEIKQFNQHKDKGEEQEMMKTQEDPIQPTNVTFTDEISPIQNEEEEFDILEKIKSNNKNMIDKENKLTLLLNEYKQRIDQNKNMLKSRSSVDMKQLSTANSQKPPIGKQFEKYEKNVVQILNDSKLNESASKTSRHNFNSDKKENETDSESLKNAREEISQELSYLREQQQ